MKNVSKKTNGQNATSFASFLNVKLDKSAQRVLKGGGDTIITEDEIDG